MWKTGEEARGSALRRDPSTQLMVMEVACNDPNCAPIDTIVILE